MLAANNAPTATFGEFIREKIDRLLDAPDCGVNDEPAPALDDNGKPIQGLTVWTVTVRGTLPGDYTEFMRSVEALGTPSQESPLP